MSDAKALIVKITTKSEAVAREIAAKIEEIEHEGILKAEAVITGVEHNPFDLIWKETHPGTAQRTSGVTTDVTAPGGVPELNTSPAPETGPVARPTADEKSSPA